MNFTQITNKNMILIFTGITARPLISILWLFFLLSFNITVLWVARENVANTWNIFPWFVVTQRRLRMCVAVCDDRRDDPPLLNTSRCSVSRDRQCTEVTEIPRKQKNLLLSWTRLNDKLTDRGKANSHEIEEKQKFYFNFSRKYIKLLLCDDFFVGENCK